MSIPRITGWNADVVPQVLIKRARDVVDLRILCFETCVKEWELDRLAPKKSEAIIGGLLGRDMNH